MNLKKVLAIVLAAQMLLAGFAACSKDPSTETNAPAGETGNTPAVTETKAPETAAPETQAPETEFDRNSVSDNVPELKFGSRDFRFLTQDLHAYQVYSEDDSGVGLAAEVYNRNVKVQDRFDIKITTIPCDILTADKMVQYRNVGEHVFEVNLYPQFIANTPAIYFAYQDWNELPYLNFDQPWWNKQAIDNYTFGGYSFNLASDLSLSSMQMAWCLAVNADLMADWGYPIEDLYQLVRDGEWTLDKMIEITADAWVDENGDGSPDKDDKFGFGTPVTAAVDWVTAGEEISGSKNVPWVTAMGEQVITQNETKTGFDVTIGTEKLMGVLEKLVNYHWNSKGVNINAVDSTFVAGNLGLYTTKFDLFYTHNEAFNFNTGIMPLPKYDKAQEMYETLPDENFTMFGIPITLPEEDFEMVGAVMEVLSAESWKTVMPAYYNEALKGRYSTDAGMAEMVDLITAGMTYEYATSCAQSFPSEGKLPCTFNILIEQNNTDLASVLAEYGDHIERSLSELMLFYNIIETERWGTEYDTWDQLIARFGAPRHVEDMIN